MSQEFNFAEVEAAKSGGFLHPGYYKMKITKAEFVEPKETKDDGSPKTPYLELNLEGNDGGLTEKFYVTPKTLARLQYLHEAWFGKKLDKAFESSQQVGAYFAKAFEAAKGKFEHIVTVGGKQSEKDGKIYACLPYSGFITTKENADKMGMELGEFEEGSYNYTQHVQMAKNLNVPTTDSAMVPDSALPFGNDAASERLPWE